MTKNAVFLMAVCCLVLVAFIGSAPGNRLNPYAPFNAPAAEPLTPYNNYETPKISIEAYPPCPACGYAGYLLPDVPPISQPIKGPFWVDYPVP